MISKPRGKRRGYTSRLRGSRRTLCFETLEARQLLAAQLLPDLQPWANVGKGYLYNWQIDTQSMAGHTLLRLTAANTNVGAGVMQLIGGAPNGDGTQQVYQRIYNDDGTFTDQLAGNFVYHPTHHHFHFEGFCEYDLLARSDDNSVGTLAAGGAKTSFCLEDVDAFSKTLPNAPQTAVYTQCSATLQGISVGWADVYSAQLDGQWIDITGVADGKYYLQIVDDPQNRLVEADETNNSVKIAIDLHLHDDTSADAFDAGDLASPVAYDEFVGSSDVNDFYKFTLDAPAAASLKLTGLSQDADSKLLDSAGAQIAKSSNGGVTDDVINQALPAGTYYAQVIAFNGNTTYHLTLSQGEVIAPHAPSALMATAISGSQIKLTWTDNATDNSNYVVERSSDGGSSFSALPQIGDVTTFTDTGLTPGKTYFYRVRAIAGTVSSDFSNVASASLPTNQNLISAGSTWKYSDKGTDLGSSWRSTSYNDATWKSGKAQLGYGDGDESTRVSYGSNGGKKFITTYFRQKFTIANPAQVTTLAAEMIRDDGAVVYLNGREFWRSNLPNGTINYKTLASKGVTGSDESKWQIKDLATSALLSGVNVIAVEMHQNVANSADLSFDFKLTGLMSPAPAVPLAARTQPLLFSENSIHLLNNDALI